MGILEQKNCVRSINSKIPEYARNYKNEWLFIRGINKTCWDFILKYELDASQLFVSSYSDRIKSFIKNFLKAQELGYLKDTSCFIFKKCDVVNIEDLIDNMHYDFDEDEIAGSYSVDLPRYRDFYKLFCKFYDKINIGYEDDDDVYIKSIEYYSDPRSLESGDDINYESESDGIDSDDINGLLSSEDSDSDSEDSDSDSDKL